jgi:hypothetical protein
MGGTVRILDAADGTQISVVRPLDQGTIQYRGLVEVALADFNGDGIADLAVTAADPLGANNLLASKAGKVFVYDGNDITDGTLTLLHTFIPFANHDGPDGTSGTYTNGLNIAAGDINDDGKIDLVAGTRGQVGGPNGTVIGRKEYGRLAVINQGPNVSGALDTVIGSILTPFGAGYQKGVVVAAGNLDATGGDEIAVTRGGPVARSLPADIQTLKLKAFQFADGGFTELALSGIHGSPLAPFAPLDIRRDARVAFVDTNGDSKAELVFSALDRTDNSNTQVRIATFSVDTATGFATPMSTGTGPSKSYLVGNNIVDHAIASLAPASGAGGDLAIITESNSSRVQYLDPLNGMGSGGFAIDLTTGGVALAGF